MLFRVSVRSLLSLTLAAAAVAALTVGAFAQGATLKVGAGVGSGTTAGDVYTPGEFTVHVGDSVTWTINSDEPHTITFGQGPQNQAPDTWLVSGFTAPPPTPPGPPTPVTLGPADFAGGNAFVNTGLIFHGSTATLHFTTAGDFGFFCAIHPGMAGTVHVVAASQPATAQSDADAKASATQSAILGQVSGLRTQTRAQVTQTRLANGTTQWNIFTDAINKVGPQAGGGTGYLEILEFIPASLSIAAGDTVQWTATAVHTVTFVPPGQNPASLGNFAAVPAAKPSQNYDGKSLYNSGVFLAGPNAPRSFSLTFANPGTFSYVCLIHFPLGQTGTITVGARAPTGLPATGDPATLLLLIVGGLGAGLIASGLVLYRRATR